MVSVEGLHMPDVRTPADAVAALVLSAQSADVDTVLVAGRPVKRGGVLLGSEIPSLRQRAAARGEWLRITPVLWLFLWTYGTARPPSAPPAPPLSFLGERNHLIACRRGKAKAQVAVARPILVIVCHLLADPTARFTNLGPGYYQARTDTDRKIRNHIRQIALTRPGPPPHTIYPE